MARFLALERELPAIEWPAGDQAVALLRAEAARTWELHVAGVLLGAWFRIDHHEAVLELECADATEAEAILGSIPLVAAGLITFDVIGLRPYDGWARLFDPAPGASPRGSPHEPPRG